MNKTHKQTTAPIYSQHESAATELLNLAPSRIFEQGVVVELNEQSAWVQTQRKSACGSCQSSSGCGTASLSKLFHSSTTKPIQVDTVDGLKIGDDVQLVLDESAIVKSAFMAYGMPLIGLLIGAVLVPKIAQALFTVAPSSLELFAIVGAVMGMAVAWRLTARFYRPVRPRIFKITNDN